MKCCFYFSVLGKTNIGYKPGSSQCSTFRVPHQVKPLQELHCFLLIKTLATDHHFPLPMSRSSIFGNRTPAHHTEHNATFRKLGLILLVGIQVPYGYCLYNMVTKRSLAPAKGNRWAVLQNRCS